MRAWCVSEVLRDVDKAIFQRVNRDKFSKISRRGFAYAEVAKSQNANVAQQATQATAKVQNEAPDLHVRGLSIGDNISEHASWQEAQEFLLDLV